MKIQRIAVLGGSGFVGTSLCNLLAGAGYTLRVFTRQRARRRSNLILLPELELRELDIHDPAALVSGLSGCDAAINLVGILNERGTDGSGFQHAHVALAEKLLQACRENNIRRILYVSSLHADARGASHYLRSKGQAEDLLHNNACGIRVTSFQPSVIFGPRDHFFNRFASLLRLCPVLPLACPRALLTPVHVLDVAEVMMRSLRDSRSYGRRLVLCGDDSYTLLGLVRHTRKLLELKRLILPLADGPSRLQAWAFDLLAPLFNVLGIIRPFSMDNYRSLQQGRRTPRHDLGFYGLRARNMETEVPGYLCHD